MTVTPVSLPKWACIVTAILRVLMGLAFVVFGANAFLNFIPPPPPDVMAEPAMAFAGALAESGYMMPLIGLTQIASGLALVVNRFVALALVLLAPFLVNAVLFHLFLEPMGLVNALIFAAIELWLAWVYRAAYRPLFMAAAPYVCASTSRG